MYPISTALKEAFESGAMQYARITIGQTVIENSRIRERSLSVNRYALAEETVLFGSCVAAEANVMLENGDHAYSADSFLDAEAFIEIGAKVNGIVSYVPIGYFTIDVATRERSLIKLSALDRMMNFEQLLPDNFTVNETVDDLLTRVCTACHVQRGTFTLPVNGSVTVQGTLDDAKTYRDILRYIAEITGTIAYISYDGKLMLGWYGDTATFSIALSNRKSGSVDEESTTITSVSIVMGDDMVTSGTGAKIVVRDNPLVAIASSTPQQLCDALYNHVNGYTYTTFDAVVLAAPQLFPLDAATFTDNEGNDHFVCCTDWLYTLNCDTKIAGKGGKKAYGRGYSLAEAVFTAANIATGAVTAEKINVQDLAALRATIAGWRMSYDSLYKDIAIGTYTYRVQLHAPTTPTASTQAISVSRRLTANPNDPWEYVSEIMYNGRINTKDIVATDGTFTGTINTNNGFIGGWEITNEQIRRPNSIVDYDEFSIDSSGEIRITHPTGGSYHSYEEALQTTIRDGVVQAAHGGIVHGAVFAGFDFATMSGDGIEVHNQDYEIGVPGGLQSRLGYEELVVKNRDILRTHRSLVGGYATSIPANADLNNIAYLSVGRYICASDATAASLSNSPAEYAFFMEVLAPISDTIDNESTGTGVYRIQKITRFDGVEYTRKANSGSTAGTFTFEPWYRKHDARVSEENSAYWMKTQTSRPSSLDFTHIGTDSRGHMRLDLSTSAQTGGVNAVFGEGYVQTFMWDTNAKWDAQFYIPDDDGKSPAFRTYNASSNTWSEVKRCVCETEGTTTIDGIEWTWQKYTDGYVDMYADITVKGTWASWGNQYVLRNANSTTYQLPFTLSKKLVDTTSVVGWEGDTACYPVNYTSIVQTGVSENYTTCDIGRPSAGSNNTNYYCRKYIRGKLQTSRNLLHMA